MYYRTALADAQKALTFKSDYEKSELRCAQCLLYLKRYEECLEACTKYTDKYGMNDKVTELRKKARDEHLQQLRDERKRANDERKKGELLSRTVAELKKRGIRFEEQTDKSNLADLLRPVYIPLEDFPIRIDQLSDELSWPAVFCYPEFEFCDFQQCLSDNVV